MKKIIICLLTVVMLVMMMLPADIAMARGRVDRGPAATNQTSSNSSSESSSKPSPKSSAKSPLVADFDFSICSSCSLDARISVTFTDKSSGGVSPYKYDWDFGDGSQHSSGRNPKHRYDTSGNYTVTLTVTDRARNVASTSKTITLGSASTADTEAVTSDISATAAGTWPRCNDGCEAGDATTVDAWLVVTDPDCAPGENNTAELWLTFSITRKNGPYCVVAVMDIYVDGVLTDDEYTIDMGDLPGKGEWDYKIKDIIWPCGAELELRDIYVQWMVNDTDPCGEDCKDYPPSKCWMGGPIYVRAPLVADFDYEGVCFCDDCNTIFTDTTTGGVEPYISWYWDFGDGSDSTDQNPTHHYASTGTYTVTLTVTDSDYISDDQSYDVTIYASPTVNLTGDTSSCEANITITASVTGGTPPYTYYWSDSTAPGTPNNGSYTATGSGAVEVTVTDANGCTDSDSIEVSVYELPACHITASPDTEACAGTDVTLTEDGGDAVSWYWTTAETTQSIVVSTSDTYGVTITDENGCESYCEIEITVYELPACHITASPDTEVCAGTDVTLTEDGGDAVSWYWTTGETTSSIVVSTSDTYGVTITDENGCESYCEIEITVYTLPEPWASSNSPVCEGVTIELYGGPADMASYNWTGPEGFTSNLQNPTIPNATLDMTGIYTLTVTNSNGCTNYTTTYVVVNEKPEATASSNSPVFQGATIQLIGGPDGMASYYWTGPDGWSSNLQNPTRNGATTAMAGTYTLTVTSENGCSDDDTTNVEVTVPQVTPAGAAGCPTPRYLTVDWEGCITSKILYSNNRLSVDLLGPSSDGIHSLLLERGTLAPSVHGVLHYLIIIRELEEIPPVPENTVALVAFNVTPAGAVFDRDIFLTLGLDELQLPQNALNVTMAYYDSIQGLWVELESEIGGPNGVAELTFSAPINHFSIYGVLAEFDSTPIPPAHFVSSGLNIVPSVEKTTFVTKTGESVTITANVANDGWQQGTYTVQLKLNGQIVDTKTVTVPAGQSKQVSFTRSGLDYGKYDVEAAGLTGEFTAARTIAWWLIIVIIAAVGLIIWGVVWSRRRRKAHQEA